MTEVQQPTATGYTRFIDNQIVKRLMEDYMQVTVFNNFFTGFFMIKLLNTDLISMNAIFGS